MLDTQREIADALARVMSDAFTHGLTTDDIGAIAKMVAAQQPLDLDYSAQHAAELANGADDLPIYTELPEGLIDLPSAMMIYDGGRPRLRNWVKRGYLEIHGRLRAPAPGGGYIIVSKSELMEKLATGEKTAGRPRKN